ncbi:MAG: CCA tRNA nucleotidyltransferase [Lachnospiraceae bacterium]|nr:CCA tRNA nucleotidyltransferase [Lachnospiraceae bacterium]
MNIQVPEKVNKIIETLLAQGYEAYAVGGCVRDSLLGREADDWDITTSASPYEVKALFRRTIDTGIQHGTVTVMFDKEGFEVTTYRIDGEYEDGRHPKEVLFTKNLEEDLKRRDFTINAMAYNEQTGMVDIFGGVEDLQNKIIRCVGVAGDRFDEDALRIMRAFRFSAQLGFSIEEKTRMAAAERAENLRKISAERIRVELTKLLLSKNPDRLLMMQQNGITRIVLPEFDAMLATEQRNKNHSYSVGEHTLRVIEFVGNRDRQCTGIRELLSGFPAETVLSAKTWAKKELQILRFAALLHDVAKPKLQVTDGQGEHRFPNHAEHGMKLAREIMRRLKFDNETTDFVVRLVGAHNQYIVWSGSEKENLAAMRHMMYRLGPDLMELLWELQLADVLAQHPANLQGKLEMLAKSKQLHQRILEQGDCVSLKQLAVNGKDLIELGIQPGKQIGEVLERLLEQVLDNPALNEKSVLLSQGKQFLT